MQTFKHCFKLMFFNERKRRGGQALFLPYKFGYHLFNGREKNKTKKYIAKLNASF